MHDVDEEEFIVSRIQRIAALVAVGLFGAIGVTGVMADAGGVFGGSSDDSTAAAESAGIQTPDSLVAESGDTPGGETEDIGVEPADDGDVEDGDHEDGDHEDGDHDNGGPDAPDQSEDD